MATSQSTTHFILDQLSSVPNVRVRKMFGEYALYCGSLRQTIVLRRSVTKPRIRARDRVVFALAARSSATISNGTIRAWRTP